MSAADSRSRGKLRESKPESYPSRIARAAPLFLDAVAFDRVRESHDLLIVLVGEPHSVIALDMK
jgi:hypothetical protein